MDDNSEDEFEENFGELDDEIVPDLEAVHEELIENGSSQEQAAFMDPADSEQTTFDLEIEPIPMTTDPYGHPTLPFLQNATLFNKVPNVEIIGEQVPADPRSRLYGNASKPDQNEYSSVEN